MPNPATKRSPKMNVSKQQSNTTDKIRNPNKGLARFGAWTDVAHVRSGVSRVGGHLNSQHHCHVQQTRPMTNIHDLDTFLIHQSLIRQTHVSQASTKTSVDREIARTTFNTKEQGR
jgi:hypothetical protein